MKIAVYSGTFDPITNGHMSIIERASGLFDKVYVAVATDTYKNTMFDVEERVALVKASTANFDNVETEVFTGLLVDYANPERRAPLCVACALFLILNMKCRWRALTVTSIRILKPYSLLPTGNFPW